MLGLGGAMLIFVPWQQRLDSPPPEPSSALRQQPATGSAASGWTGGWKSRWEAVQAAVRVWDPQACHREHKMNLQ